MTKDKDDYRLRRVSATELVLPNDHGIPTRIFAGSGVAIERAAVTEALRMLEVSDTVRRLKVAAPHLFDHWNARIESVSFSSDMHKGAGIPIGTTIRSHGVMIPAAVGKDVNCGMRVGLTGWTADDISPHLDRLERALRHIFFQGGRRIGLTSIQREAMLAEGMPGLLMSGALHGAEWDDAANELDCISGRGGYPTAVPAAFSDYVRGAGGDGQSFDSQIGSLGGGNHFAEIQVVRRLLDRATAHAWGIREGMVVIMIHTGSLGMGHVAQDVSSQAVRSLLPAGFSMPANGILPLPMGAGAAVTLVRSAHRAAANFAFANRHYLAQMMRRAIAETIDDSAPMRLLWDSPHNLLWEDGDGAVTHRKGSTPARSTSGLADSPYSWGEPVIVPGSMGAPSYILRGLGHTGALESACHGAGRALSRGDAARGHEAALDAFLGEFRVVTPVDPRQICGRDDLISAWRESIAQEGPHAYKAIGPVIETIRAAGIAEPVAELYPIMTVKG